MFSLHVFHALYCSIDLQDNVLHRSKDHRHFYLNYPQISKVGKSVHMACTGMKFKLQPTPSKVDTLGTSSDCPPWRGVRLGGR